MSLSWYFFYPRIMHVLLLLVLARKTLNQTLRQVKKVNVVATVGKHQEVKFSLLYNEELHQDSNGGYLVVEWIQNEILNWYWAGTWKDIHNQWLIQVANRNTISCFIFCCLIISRYIDEIPGFFLFLKIDFFVMWC